MQRGMAIKLGQSLGQDTTLYGVFQQVGERLLYRKGEIIHFQGDEPEAFYMIETGRLRSYLLSEDGRQVTLEMLGPGKLFGQASYFGQVPRPTSAMAETELEMLAMDYGRLQPYLADPQLVREMFDLMGYSIRMLTLQIGGMAFYRADERVIQALLQLRSFSEQEADEVYCTHEELAELTGLNRVTVTRVLHILAEQGWVELHYGCIKLLNIQKLRGYEPGTQKSAGEQWLRS